MKKKNQTSLKLFSRVLAIIGGVLDIFYSIHGIIQGRWIGILGIFIGLLTLIATNVIPWNQIRLQFNWQTILILGILSLFTACTIPAIIIIISAILLLI